MLELVWCVDLYVWLAYVFLSVNPTFGNYRLIGRNEMERGRNEKNEKKEKPLEAE